jgi:hypothetical protein
MKEWNLRMFKKSHPSLLTAIIGAMKDIERLEREGIPQSVFYDMRFSIPWTEKKS